jgi:hypothetical protein
MLSSLRVREAHPSVLRVLVTARVKLAPVALAVGVTPREGFSFNRVLPPGSARFTVMVTVPAGTHTLVLVGRAGARPAVVDGARLAIRH